MRAGEKGTIISEWIRECIRQHKKKEGKTKLNKSDTRAHSREKRERSGTRSKGLLLLGRVSVCTHLILRILLLLLLLLGVAHSVKSQGMKIHSSVVVVVDVVLQQRKGVQRRGEGKRRRRVQCASEHT